MNITELIGYFESPQQMEPAFDPGLEVNCIVCEKPLYDPIFTYSFIATTGFRSYFYRVHKNCDPSEIEGSLVDEVLGR